MPISFKNPAFNDTGLRVTAQGGSRDVQIGATFDVSNRGISVSKPYISGVVPTIIGPVKLTVGDNIIPHNQSGFYSTPVDHAISPFDCENYPDSPFCGGNPLTSTVAGFDNTEVSVDQCGIRACTTPALGFIRMPRFCAGYNNPKCYTLPSPLPKPYNNIVPVPPPQNVCGDGETVAIVIVTAYSYSYYKDNQQTSIVTFNGAVNDIVFPGTNGPQRARYLPNGTVVYDVPKIGINVSSDYGGTSTLQNYKVSGTDNGEAYLYDTDFVGGEAGFFLAGRRGTVTCYVGNYDNLTSSWNVNNVSTFYKDTNTTEISIKTYSVSLACENYPYIKPPPRYRQPDPPLQTPPKPMGCCDCATINTIVARNTSTVQNNLQAYFDVEINNEQAAITAVLSQLNNSIVQYLNEFEIDIIKAIANLLNAPSATNVAGVLVAIAQLQNDVDASFTQLLNLSTSIYVGLGDLKSVPDKFDNLLNVTNDFSADTRDSFVRVLDAITLSGDNALTIQHTYSLVQSILTDVQLLLNGSLSLSSDMKVLIGANATNSTQISAISSTATQILTVVNAIHNTPDADLVMRLNSILNLCNLIESQIAGLPKTQLSPQDVNLQPILNAIQSTQDFLSGKLDQVSTGLSNAIGAGIKTVIIALTNQTTGLTTALTLQISSLATVVTDGLTVLGDFLIGDTTGLSTVDIATVLNQEAAILKAIAAIQLPSPSSPSSTPSPSASVDLTPIQNHLTTIQTMVQQLIDRNTQLDLNVILTAIQTATSQVNNHTDVATALLATEILASIVAQVAILATEIGAGFVATEASIAGVAEEVLVVGAGVAAVEATAAVIEGTVALVETTAAEIAAEQVVQGGALALIEGGVGTIGAAIPVIEGELVEAAGALATIGAEVGVIEAAIPVIEGEIVEGFATTDAEVSGVETDLTSLKVQIQLLRQDMDSKLNEVLGYVELDPGQIIAEDWVATGTVTPSPSPSPSPTPSPTPSTSSQLLESSLPIPYIGPQLPTLTELEKTSTEDATEITLTQQKLPYGANLASLLLAMQEQLNIIELDVKQPSALQLTRIDVPVLQWVDADGTTKDLANGAATLGTKQIQVVAGTEALVQQQMQQIVDLAEWQYLHPPSAIVPEDWEIKFEVKHPQLVLFYYKLDGSTVVRSDTDPATGKRVYYRRRLVIPYPAITTPPTASPIPTFNAGNRMGRLEIYSDSGGNFYRTPISAACDTDENAAELCMEIASFVQPEYSNGGFSKVYTGEYQVNNKPAFKTFTAVCFKAAYYSKGGVDTEVKADWEQVFISGNQYTAPSFRQVDILDDKLH